MSSKELSVSSLRLIVRYRLPKHSQWHHLFVTLLRGVFPKMIPFLGISAMRLSACPPPPSPPIRGCHSESLAWFLWHSRYDGFPSWHKPPMFGLETTLGGNQISSACREGSSMNHSTTGAFSIHVDRYTFQNMTFLHLCSRNEAENRKQKDNPSKHERLFFIWSFYLY